MSEEFELTRRQLLAMSLAAGGSVLAGRLDPLFAQLPEGWICAAWKRGTKTR